MNKPLMFTNNTHLMEQLKARVWQTYKTIKAGDFQEWYDGLSPIEQSAWKVKFEEVND
tara:strand:+ start:142 stop:315 length:174 start_codon:yes stop_codon:yes gene_type:complete